MNTRKIAGILGTLLLLMVVLLTSSGGTRPAVHAAPDAPAFSYSISPTTAYASSTSRVTLTISNLLGATPPSSRWFDPDGDSVSKGCMGGQLVREYIYIGGSLFEVKDYFYVSSCNRDPGTYEVYVGSDYAGSFNIVGSSPVPDDEYVYLPAQFKPATAPPNAFSKVSPADGFVGTTTPALFLDWEDTNAGSYDYCYDTTDDNACSNWQSVSESGAQLDGLGENTIYYWQVRGVNSLGTTYANGSNTAFWSFTTGEAFEGSWSQQTASASWTGREDHASVVLSDDTIILMGGQDENGNTNDVWRSTDKGATWTPMTANAEWSDRRAHCSVVLSDDSIVLFGGSTSLTSYFSDVWRSTDQGATWTPMTVDAEWSARSSMVCVALSDDSIVLMAGYDMGRLDDVWRSTDQGATWTPMTADAEWSPRSKAFGVALPDDRIVIMGGSLLSSYSSAVFRSTDIGATWTSMTDQAGWTTRCCAASVVLNDGSTILMGGYHNPNVYNDVWRSIDQGATWEEITANANWSARANHTSVVLSTGEIVLMGGDDGDLKNDVWRFTRN